jgi:hypothetical protein
MYLDIEQRGMQGLKLGQSYSACSSALAQAIL